MATIATSISAIATAYSNQRRVDRCQSGVLWSMFHSGGNLMYLAYSTDGGTTWTNDGANAFSYSGTSASYTPNGSLFVDLDDNAHAVYKDLQNGYLYYRRGAPNAARTSYTWSTAVVLHTSNIPNYPDLVAFRKPGGGGWDVHIVHDFVPSNSQKELHYSYISVASDGTFAAPAYPTTLSTTGAGQMNPQYPSIDFRHSGDGKTVAGGQPDLFVGWSNGSTGSGYGIRFRKATYSGGSWTWGTEREIDNTLYLNGTATWLNCIYDGTRVVLAGWLFKGSDGSYSTIVHDRDATDTTTTPRTLANGSSTNAGAIARGSATYDSLGNVYRVGDSNGVVFSQRWVRSSGAVDPRVTIDSTDVSSSFASTRRGYQGQAIDYVYTDGTASPYTVTSGRITLNTAPNSGDPLSPVGNQRVDRTQPIPLLWNFSDPDSGDSQSRADVRYRVVATPANPWTTITNAANTASRYDIPANTFAAETQFEWQDLPYDSQGVPASAWSTSAFATASDPTQPPTILAPTNGGTIPSSSYLVQWASANQDAYELRRVADSSGTPNTGTRYYETGTVEDSTSRSRQVTFETNNRVEHVQVRVRKGGLWSAWASVRATVSFTPPATPTLAIAAVQSRADWLGTDAIDVAITNPTPGGSQPTVVSHDVLIDDGTTEGLRRVATGLAPGTTWRHWTPVAGRDYAGGRIQVVAVAANGTTSTASS